MVEIELDGQKVEVAEGSMVMHAAEKAGTYIPHFCYHKKLSIAANCRMCLVEVERAPKPLPACATPVMDGMKVKTRSPLARKAQKAVMEFLQGVTLRQLFKHLKRFTPGQAAAIIAPIEPAAETMPVHAASTIRPCEIWSRVAHW